MNARIRHFASVAAVCVLCWAMLPPTAVGQDSRSGPPLNEDQTARIRELVRTTQARDIELKTGIERCQRALAAAYAEFELDTMRVEELQGRIVELQRQLLANYHRMHVELRAIVGPERFVVLRQRIDLVLNPPAKGEPGKTDATPERQAPPRSR
jgi:hypothetical protein